MGCFSSVFSVNLNRGRVNAAPVISDQTFSIPENSANGTAVGTVAASDPDAGQTLTYSILSGNTLGCFAINSTTGILTIADNTNLNFEVNPTFSLVVRVTDNYSTPASSQATITVNLTDVYEISITSPASVNVPENTLFVCRVTASEDSTFLITGGTDQSRCTIDSGSGNLYLNSGQDFENPIHVNNQLALIIQATSIATGLTCTQNLTIQITDVYEPLNDYKSAMKFLSGNIDFATGQWLDQSGNNNHAQLVDSWCLSFNGTSSTCLFTLPSVGAMAHIKIAAKPTAGNWTLFTESTAPTGLYSVSGNTLTLGKSGSTYFSGQISCVYLYDSGNVLLKELPISQGQDTMVYGSFSITPGSQKSTNMTAQGQTDVVDSNADGLADGWNFIGTGTPSIVTGNGFSGRAQRLDCSGTGDFYLEFNTGISSTVGAGVYIKFKYRLNGTYLWPKRGASQGFLPSYVGSLNTGTAKEMIVKGKYTSAVNQKFRFELDFGGSAGKWFEIGDVEIWDGVNESGTATNCTWSQTGTMSHINLQRGFDLWRKSDDQTFLRIPLNVDGTSRVGNGETFLAPFSYVWLAKVLPIADGYINLSESKVQFPSALEAYDSGNFMFDASHNANKLTYSNFKFGNKVDRIFSGYNYDGIEVIKDFAVFTTALTGSDLTTITDYYNSKINELGFYRSADGTSYYIRSPYSTTQDKVVKMNIGIYNTNPVTQFYECRKIPIATMDCDFLASYGSGTILNGYQQDEISAFVTNSAIMGSGHSLNLVKVTASLNLDDTDKGSEWNHSGGHFKYCGKAGSDYIFLQVASESTDGDFTVPTLLSGNTLTHVSGAVHTNDQVCTTVGQYGVASVREILRTAVTNRGTIAVGGNIKCQSATFYDENYVVYTPTLIASEFPTFGTTERWITVKYQFIFKRNSSIEFVTDVNLHKSTTFPYYLINGAQSYLANTTSAYRYVPKTKAFNYGDGSEDLSKKFLVSHLSTDHIVTLAACLDASNPADRVVDTYVSGKLWAAIGYFKEFGQGLNRLAEIGSNANGFIVLSQLKKVYPNCTVGNHYGIMPTSYMYRDIGNTDRSDSATCVYYVARGDQWYMFIDYHASVTGEKIDIPDFLVGKTFTVLEKDSSFTVNTSGVLTKTNGVNVTTVSTSGSLSWCVLKIG